MRDIDEYSLNYRESGQLLTRLTFLSDTKMISFKFISPYHIADIDTFKLSV